MSLDSTRRTTRSGPTASVTRASTRANCTSRFYSKCWAPKSRWLKWRPDCGAAAADCEARAWKRAIGVRLARGGSGGVQESRLGFAGGPWSLRHAVFMGRRRGETDALRPVKEPRWLVVRDRFSRVIESLARVRRRDLRAAMQATRDRRRSEGWAVEDVPRNCSFVFYEIEGRAGVRVDRVLRAGPGRFATMFDPTVRRASGNDPPG
jgi:hypothetical protein